MQQKPDVLLVEDHSYFASEIRDYLESDCGYKVIYAANYADACRAVKRYGPFKFSFLDILLQNGKTGVDLVERYEQELGRVMFITGCVDETILNKIAEHASASKLQEIWPQLEDFLEGGMPRINSNESSAYRVAVRLQGARQTY